MSDKPSPPDATNPTIREFVPREEATGESVIHDTSGCPSARPDDGESNAPAAAAPLTAATLIQRLARSEIIALQAYTSARSLTSARQPVPSVCLNANENPWPPENDAGMILNRYPDPQPAELRARLADFYGLNDEQLLLTRGSDEGIDLLLRAFCRAGHDRIAVCPPCFGMYEVAARIQGAAVDYYPLRAHQAFQPDFKALARTTAKLIFLCTPNNPTGNLLPATAVLNLAAHTADRALVVVDEAYIEFAGVPSLCDRLADYPNLVVLRTLSKAWAMAGARLGVVAADPAMICLLRKILAPYPLPTPTVRMALAALQQEQRMYQQVQLLRLERQRIADRVAALPWVQQCFPSAANFLLLRVDDAAALVANAARAGITLRDQSQQQDLGQCVRISVGSPAENDALLNFLESR